MNTKCFRPAILVLLWVPLLAYGQDTTRYSRIGITVGITSVKLKDQFYSPFTYSGTIPEIGISYSKYYDGRAHQFDLNYSGGTIRSQVSPKATYRAFSLDYNYYFRRLSIPNDKLDIQFGPGVQGFLANVNYLPGIEEPVTYMSGNISISANAIFRYRLSDRIVLSLTAGLPLGSYVYRPDFEIDGKTLNTFVFARGTIQGEAAIQYKITRRLSIKAAYRYAYLSIQDPRPLHIMHNGLSLSVVLRF